MTAFGKRFGQKSARAAEVPNSIDASQSDAGRRADSITSGPDAT